MLEPKNVREAKERFPLMDHHRDLFKAIREAADFDSFKLAVGAFNSAIEADFGKEGLVAHGQSDSAWTAGLQGIEVTSSSDKNSDDAHAYEGVDFSSVQVAVESGNLKVMVSVSGCKQWSQGGKVRVYFDLVSSSKRMPISKIYEVVSGDTRDEKVQVGGRVFAYELGFCDSKTKRAAAAEGARALIAVIAEVAGRKAL